MRLQYIIDQAGSITFYISEYADPFGCEFPTSENAGADQLKLNIVAALRPVSGSTFQVWVPEEGVDYWPSQSHGLYLTRPEANKRGKESQVVPEPAEVD